MKAYFFDIETAPLPEADIAHLVPEFSAPANYKDEIKIRAYLDAARVKWLEEAALNAMTGRVLVVGVSRPTVSDCQLEFLEGDEEFILETFWGMFSTGGFERLPWVGFNCKGFDLPFLIQRSWHLKVPLPAVFSGRYFSDRIIDLMEVFSCFQKGAKVSLDRVSKFLGSGEKNGNGADFAKLYASDRAKALEYLANDIKLLQSNAALMGAEMFAPKLKEAA